MMSTIDFDGGHWHHWQSRARCYFSSMRLEPDPFFSRTPAPLLFLGMNSTPTVSPKADYRPHASASGWGEGVPEKPGRVSRQPLCFLRCVRTNLRVPV